MTELCGSVRLAADWTHGLLLGAAGNSVQVLKSSAFEDQARQVFTAAEQAGGTGTDLERVESRVIANTAAAVQHVVVLPSTVVAVHVLQSSSRVVLALQDQIIFIESVADLAQPQFNVNAYP
eukprot:CAMPEP_0118986282 /NCGR_PEP_ID=MMETSP1173-20130426/41783_1 /TAXON_ID=1034831 /ORGANISM="Rhizochromulina marina cf, Strain CCMP1243" /LENGTH=121 /DNA_ID=CAMNT_0006937055 /DNA_START=18 /DNA_END=380 /DNA_ORIENTATION=-